MPHRSAIELADSSARTSSGTGASVDMGAATTAVLRLDVTAASGTTPTLAVAVQTSPDEATWTSLGNFSTRTAAGALERRFPGASRYVRAVWTIGGGTPSFTFSLAGSALTVYATPADIASLGCAGGALDDVDDETKDLALCAATDNADTELQSGSYKLPLTAWGDDLRQAVVDIAVFRLMRRRGFSPDGADSLIVKGYDDAMRWLASVGRESKTLAGVVDSTPTVHDGGAMVGGYALRGW